MSAAGDCGPILTVGRTRKNKAAPGTEDDVPVMNRRVLRLL